MIGRAEERFGLYPERLAADSAYGSAEMLGWLVYERGIEPHIPVFDKSARTDGTFEREDFSYDHGSDVYVCPAGKRLTCSGTLVNDGATLLYRAASTIAMPANSSRAAVRRRQPKGAAVDQRGGAGHGTRHCQERGRPDLPGPTQEDRDALRPSQTHPAPRQAPITRTEQHRDEFHLAATAQNLRKLAKLIPMPAPQPA